MIFAISLGKSFLVAFFTVLGGSMPIIILLLFLYKRVKEKHDKRANYQKEKILPDLKTKKEKEEQILSQWLKKLGGDELYIFENGYEKEYKKMELLMLINQQRSRISRREIEIIKTEGDIRYVQNFNFWVFLEEVLKGRYYQKDYYENRFTN